MYPLPLLLLADVTLTGFSVSDWLKLFTGGVIGLLSLSGLAVFFVRGFWVKNVEPMLQASVAAWYADPKQVVARREETLQVIEAWHRSPDALAEREQFQTRNLDNQIRRDDGLINREIHQKVQRSADTLHDTIAEQQRRMDAKDQRDTEFQAAVLDTLKELQQSVSFLQGQLSHMETQPSVGGRRLPVPPVLPPKRG